MTAKFVRRGRSFSKYPNHLCRSIGADDLLKRPLEEKILLIIRDVPDSTYDMMVEFLDNGIVDL
jgi:hypothetical protein